jgi:hypothetical protein
VQAYRHRKIAKLRAMVAQGTYVVDSDRVAEAVMRRLSGPELAEEYEQMTSHTGRVKKVLVFAGVQPSPRTGTRRFAA